MRAHRFFFPVEGWSSFSGGSFWMPQGFVYMQDERSPGALLMAGRGKRGCFVGSPRAPEGVEVGELREQQLAAAERDGPAGQRG
jgi:hypothetical protein